MRVDGACHCGLVTFTADADVETAGVCHCTDCQAISGSAFRTTVRAVPGTFALTSGTPTLYVKTTAESGNPREHAFCPRCGTSVYASSMGAEPRTYSLRFGTLKQKAAIAPKRQIWTRSRVPWLANLAGVQGFDKGRKLAGVQPSGLPFRVIPFVGAPGAGKALLVRALAGHAARWDATSVSMPRQVRIGAHASTAIDIRLPGAVVELVYFDDARAEAALIGSAPFHAAVLVVSGVDSIQPGTWDSIMQAREKGVRFALAVVTRCGEVEDPELVDLVKMEVGETLQKHLGDAVEIPVMSVDAQRAMAGMPQWAEAMGAVLRVLGG